MTSPLSAAGLRVGGPLVVLLALVAASHVLGSRSGGRTLEFALSCGACLGLVLQRSRFCFYCHARDWFERRDPRGLLAILLALAVGLVGHTVVLGSWVANPGADQLPPDMHIGPVSWVLLLAGASFGIGMVLSGSCISAHWYRLAEGSPVAPFALVGTAAGFLLGFHTWNPLYTSVIADAPVVWLPRHLGYGGALLLQLIVLGGLAAWLWRGFRGAGAEQQRTGVARNTPSLAQSWRGLWHGRWAYWSGGLAVGLISVLVIVRMKPLGVTATLGGATRQWGSERGWLPERLHGLDGFAGCATLPAATWLTPNAVLLVGLVAGSLLGALGAGQFLPRRPSWREVLRGLAGGVLLGWGAMTGLGCTIGTLLSGTMAGALSGWVFAFAMFGAVWLGLRAKAMWSEGR